MIINRRTSKGSAQSAWDHGSFLLCFKYQGKSIVKCTSFRIFGLAYIQRAIIAELQYENHSGFCLMHGCQDKTFFMRQLKFHEG